MSPTIIIIVIDYIMKQTKGNNGIQWTPFTQLEDLEFADDIGLLSHTKQQMQNKINKITVEAKKVGLNINKEKTKILKLNSKNSEKITCEDSVLEEVEKFTYLGSVVGRDGGVEADIRSRIGKAQCAFNNLKNIWRSQSMRLNNKIRLFNSNVKSILLYGSETWKLDTQLTSKLQTFVNKCLRRILGVWWPNVISNKDLWTKCNQEPIEITLKRRKWSWIGHTLRRPSHDIAQKCLEWNPVGKRRRGRPKNTWRRTIEDEAKRIGKTWSEIKNEAQNRVRWKKLVSALCSIGNGKD